MSKNVHRMINNCYLQNANIENGSKEQHFYDVISLVRCALSISRSVPICRTKKIFFVFYSYDLLKPFRRGPWEGFSPESKNGWLAVKSLLRISEEMKVVMGDWMKATGCGSLELFKPLILPMKWFQGELLNFHCSGVAPRTIRYKLAVSNHSEKPIIIGLSDITFLALFPFCSRKWKKTDK